MATESTISKLVTDEQVRKVRDFLMKTLDSVNEKGEPDLEKILYNATYNMGHAAIEIAGLVMQEKLKLESLQKQYRERRKVVYEETMTTRMGWTPTQGGVQTMLDGDENLSTLKSKIDRQTEYIEFLRAAQEQIRYYPRNAKALIEVATFGKEIGKII